MPEKLKIYFTDFWSNFDRQDNLFVKLLSEEFDIQITGLNPDILFFSYFGNNHTRFNCKRVYFTGENVKPDFRKCDYAFSFDLNEDSPKHYRLPLYALFDDVELLTRKKDIEQIIAEKTRFCNFIYSNPNSRKRIEFFKKLSKYKEVDSGGRVLNNLGSRIDNKIEFIRQYKFTIAFENEAHPGYTTEKLFESMLANSLGIYHGNDLVHKDFNTKSFLNYADYGSDEALIERIIELDNDVDKYAEYFKQPYFVDNKVNKYVDNANIKEFLMRVVNEEIGLVSANSAIFSANPVVNKLAVASSDAVYESKRLLKKYVSNFRFDKVLYRLKGEKPREPE